MAINNQADVMMNALHRRYEGRLMYLDMYRRYDLDRYSVKIVVEVDAADELDVYKRLCSVLDVAIGEAK